jgi:peptidoglycan/xylan/chitin deacetylase (PgdA/CDA1 family)
MRAVLTFHSVDNSGSVLSIAPEELRSLVGAIRRSGHRIAPLQEVLESPAEADQIALTFDDGIGSLHQHALPILRDEGAPATVFLISDYVGRNNRWPSLPQRAPTMDLMSWAEVEELYAAGWAVEAHTATHPDLRRLTDDAIRDEFQRGNDAIQAHLGCCPTIVAYPYGFWDERVRDLAASAYRYAVTTQMGVLPVEVIDPHLIPRLETYYIRAPKIHSHFGTRTFSAYLAARTMLRRLKHVD